MYLKQLAMQGFKSFPEKVKIDFNPGLTAVVGPNGSGKSNLSDAVRWVLGEQRPKSLRGDKMEDVIFAGTKNRKPVGFAEVSMTIDNVDCRLPLDYTEITVTRRVYRSGESEYQLNGVSCRLKDIHELFMDTGVGREGYSIIGQGRIDEILNAKGEDRRKLFEEAAGIVKYKTRRTEAESKLERERQNLVRIGDIIQELEGRLDTLAAQAEAAKTYLTFREELKTLELTLFCQRRETLRQQEEKLQSDLSVARDDLLRETEAQEAQKTANAALKAELEALAEAIDAASRAVVNLRSRQEQSTAEMRLTEEQIQNLEQTVQLLEAEIEKEEAAVAEGKQQVRLYQSEETSLTLSLQAETSALAEREARLAALSRTLSAGEEEVEKQKAELIELLKETSQVQGTLQRAQGMEEQFAERDRQLAQERQNAQSQAQALKEQMQTLEETVLRLQEKEEAAQKQKSRLEAERVKYQSALRELEAGFGRKQSELTEKRSRLTLLSEMEASHDGFYQSVRAILSEAKRRNPQFLGVHGAVGELLQVDKALETAVEVALGGSLQNIVTSDEEDARLAIQYLKERNLGRATFLPISAVRPRSLGRDREKLLREAGVLGSASNCVGFDEAYRGVVESLLGNTILVDTVSHGIALSKKYRQSYRIVTLEGDLFSPGGAMSGGSRQKKTANIFGRSRERKELEQTVSALESAVGALEHQRQAFLEKTGEQERALAELAEESRSLEHQILTIRGDLAHGGIQLREQQEKLMDLAREQNQLNQQRKISQEAVEKGQAELNRIQAAIEAVQSALSESQGNMTEERTLREGIAEEIAAYGLSIAQKKQNRTNILENISKEMREIEKRQESISGRSEEILRTKSLATEKLGAIALLQSSIEETLEQQNRAQAHLTELGETRKEKTKVLEAGETAVSNGFALLSRLQNQTVRLEMQAEKQKEESRRMLEELWETYEMTWQMAEAAEKSDLPVAQLQLRSRELKSRMKALGHVNIGAVEEYQEAKDRHGLLTTQRADILETEQKLQGMIADLTGLMEEQFREQLEVISENFNQVFQEMFGGGQAYLRLTSGENVLEAGIDIVAQPPGKTLQNMTLLSGGERTLTAIAILFAILKRKPSPFCILDETESALDDANVRRYAGYLSKISAETQLIVITHRKGTMEAADALYGVTMQEQGVSKMVSVTLKDAQ